MSSKNSELWAIVKPPKFFFLRWWWKIKNKWGYMKWGQFLVEEISWDWWSSIELSAWHWPIFVLRFLKLSNFWVCWLLPIAASADPDFRLSSYFFLAAFSAAFVTLPPLVSLKFTCKNHWNSVKKAVIVLFFSNSQLWWHRQRLSVSCHELRNVPKVGILRMIRRTTALMEPN